MSTIMGDDAKRIGSPDFWFCDALRCILLYKTLENVVVCAFGEVQIYGGCVPSIDTQID